MPNVDVLDICGCVIIYKIPMIELAKAFDFYKCFLTLIYVFTVHVICMYQSEFLFLYFSSPGIVAVYGTEETIF